MNSMRQGITQNHKRYHLDSCIIRALAFMYDTTIQIASDNFYLFDRRLWITERQYVVRHCSCAESSKKAR